MADKQLQANNTDIKNYFSMFGFSYIHTVQFFYERDKKKNAKHKPPLILNGLYKDIKKQLIDYNLEGYAACLMIQQGDGKGRATENVVGIKTFVIDLDGASPDAIKKAKIKPSIVVQTSPGRYHVYYLVSDCSLQQYSPIQKALAQKFGGDPAVCDLPRVMRIPGTIHWKGETPFVTELLVCKPDRIYTVAEILEGLDINVDQPTPAIVDTNEVVALTDANIEVIKTALSYIPADDRTTWLHIGMALHHYFAGNHDGYSIWTNWSSTSAKYDSNDQKKTWDSFKANGKITVGTLFYLAKQHGAPQSALITIQPKVYDLTDIGNYERLVDRVLGKIIVVAETDKLYVWNGSRWVYDKNCLHREAVTSIKLLNADWSKCTDEKEREALKIHAKNSQHRGRIDAMTQLAKKDTELSVSIEHFDVDPFIFGVANGVIDLKNGEFREAIPEEYITRFSRVVYDPEAKCPLFEKFIADIMNDDLELVLYVQKVLGYTLTGSVREHCLFFLTGKGRNGKSLLIAIIEKILGDYTHGLQPQILMEKSFVSNGPSPELAKLQGKRMVCCAEVGQKYSIDQVLLKQLTGGDRISARPLYSDVIQFDPQFKIWMTGNSKPKAPAEDEAFWRRIRLIPFNRQFLGKKDDRYLKDKLLLELPGILNWAINGCLLWQSEGLKTPKVCRDALQEYKNENDSLSQWLAECCVEDPNAKLPASIAYDGYMNWCISIRIKHLSITEFSNVMSLKFNKKRKSGGFYYVGININSDAMKFLN